MKYFQRKKIFPLFSLVVFVLFGVFLSARPVDAILPGFGGITTTILNVIWQFISWIINQLVILIINIIVSVAQYNDFLKTEVVNEGWTILRDLCNMFFILILLVIAFSTTLKIENYSYKRLLAPLLIMAVLVNFSKTICGVVIDFAQVIMLTFVNAFKDVGAQNLVLMFQMDKQGSIHPSSLTGWIVGDWETVISNAVGAFISFIVLIVLGIVLAILVWRIVMLWILIILSPLAFVMRVLPGTQKYAQQWQDKFVKQVIVGPVMAFFIWLAFFAFQVKDLEKAASGSSETLMVPASMWSASRFAQFGFGVAMFLAAIWAAQQLGVAGASLAGKGMAFLQKAGTKIAKAPLAAAKFGLGAGIDKIAEKTGLDLNLPRVWKRFKAEKEAKLEERLLEGRVKAPRLEEKIPVAMRPFYTFLSRPDYFARNMWTLRGAGEMGLQFVDPLRKGIAFLGQRFGKKGPDGQDWTPWRSGDPKLAIEAEKKRQEKYEIEIMKADYQSKDIGGLMIEGYQNSLKEAQNKVLEKEHEVVVINKEIETDEKVLKKNREDQKEITQKIKTETNPDKKEYLIQSKTNLENFEKQIVEKIKKGSEKRNELLGELSSAKAEQEKYITKLKDLEEYKRVNSGQFNVEAQRWLEAEITAKMEERKKLEEQYNKKEEEIKKKSKENENNIKETEEKLKFEKDPEEIRKLQAILDILKKEQVLLAKGVDKEEKDEFQKKKDQIDLKIELLKKKRGEKTEVTMTERERKVWDKKKKNAELDKKGFEKLFKDSKMREAYYRPAIDFESRVKESALIRKKARELEGIDNADELNDMMASAIERKDNYKVAAIMQKMAQDYNDNEFLNYFGYHSNRQGMKNFANDILQKKLGLSEQTALSWIADISYINESRNHWETSRLVTSEGGKLRWATEEEHVAAALSEISKLDIRRIVSQFNRLAYGGESPDRKFELSKLGLAILKLLGPRFIDQAGFLPQNVAFNLTSPLNIKMMQDFEIPQNVINFLSDRAAVVGGLDVVEATKKIMSK